jgi:hypothetical protein
MGEKRGAKWAPKPLTSRVFSVTTGVAEGAKPNFLPALRERPGIFAATN